MSRVRAAGSRPDPLGYALSLRHARLSVYHGFRVREGACRPPASGVLSAPVLRIGLAGAVLEARRGVVDARTLTFVKEGIRIAP